MTSRLREAFRFHLEQGGYSVPPGRAACALESARNEIRAAAEEIEFVWEYDETPDVSWLDQKGWERAKQDYLDGRMEMLGCSAEHPALGKYDVSLWSISLYLDDRTYKRVVEAELAGEALHIIDAHKAEEAGLHREVTP
jgi:hypothetical protein